MFHFLEYPFSRGWTHIKSADPYASPDFDAGFMNDERDMVPMVWGYIKSRETARRMDAYAGEVQNMHPFFDFDSEARAHDLNLEDTNRYALPGNLTAGIQHGSWSAPCPDADEKPAGDVVTSNRKAKRKELRYSKRDVEAVEDWVKRHVETTWHCLGVSVPFPYATKCQKGKRKGGN
jgi:alcohol oxidase